ncbi:hypothetical protein OS493_027567 [Desmophyllum pertusum]|uniref:Uncharacterized protein n=1 Tax=Desmophyllum pertusum TaxID=174260 RepID=A0A9X0D7A6_9CNID|nr:hypothetical protein OS493_027567 [Desmophyllum pertusum]
MNPWSEKDAQNYPKRMVDACVESFIYLLTSAIAPELRRGYPEPPSINSVGVTDSHRKEVEDKPVNRVNSTNLDAVDIRPSPSSSGLDLRKTSYVRRSPRELQTQSSSPGVPVNSRDRVAPVITLITRESVWKKKILLNDPEITSRKNKTNTEKRKG